MNSKILFIGRTNTRLSRFAEGLFNSAALNHALRWKALSRGLASHESETRIDPQLLKELPNWKIEPSHLAASKMPLTVRDLMSAKRLVVWESQFPLLREKFPTWAEKVECWSFDPEGPLMPLASRVFDLLEELGAGPIQRRALLKKTTLRKQPKVEKQGTLEQKTETSRSESQPEPSKSDGRSESKTAKPEATEIKKSTISSKQKNHSKNSAAKEPETEPKKQPDLPEQNPAKASSAQELEQVKQQAQEKPAKNERVAISPASSSLVSTPEPVPLATAVQEQFPFEDSVPLTRAVKAAMRLRAFA